MRDRAGVDYGDRWAHGSGGGRVRVAALKDREGERVFLSKFPRHRFLLRWLRLGHSLDTAGFGKLSVVVDMVNRVIFSVDIPSRMDIPRSVWFLHNGLGCVVDERVRFTGPALIM